MIESDFQGFKPATLQFLMELKVNNTPDWFQQNKQRYENDVLFPALDFVVDIGKQLPKVSNNFTAIPKRIGGSVMRIYRDARFSKDKTPYKTNLGIQFRHRLAKDVHAPAYYVHFAPDECFVGVGTWHPPSDALLRIREHIVEYPEKWISTRDNKKFNTEFRLMGDKLKSAPRGFDKDHELIDDLKWKDFIADKHLKNEDILRKDFPEIIIEHFKAAQSLMKFLCDALGVPF